MILDLDAAYEHWQLVDEDDAYDDGDGNRFDIEA